MKIPKKFVRLTTGILMSFFMAFIMSGIVTFINLGFPENFVSIWMEAFIKVAPIAFFAITIVRPIVEKIVANIVE